MIEKAVLDGGQVVGFRQIQDWNAYPQHKKDATDDKGDGGPTLRDVERTGSGSIETLTIEQNVVRIVRSEPVRPLQDVKDELKRKVDVDAEARRQQYITPGDGMGMTYREKFEQAELVNEIGEAAANALSEADRTAAYPTLAASVGLEAATLWDCAQLVRTSYSQFAMLSNTIEKTRLAGKKAISDASTVQAAQDAYEAITWTV